MTPKQKIEKLLGFNLPDNFIEDSKVSPRGQQVIKMRFGFEDGISKNLEEVGNHFGITRERVRQIEFTAMKVLRMQYQKKP